MLFVWSKNYKKQLSDNRVEEAPCSAPTKVSVHSAHLISLSSKTYTWERKWLPYNVFVQTIHKKFFWREFYLALKISRSKQPLYMVLGISLQVVILNNGDVESETIPDQNALVWPCHTPSPAPLSHWAVQDHTLQWSEKNLHKSVIHKVWTVCTCIMELLANIATQELNKIKGPPGTSTVTTKWVTCNATQKNSHYATLFNRIILILSQG